MGGPICSRSPVIFLCARGVISPVALRASILASVLTDPDPLIFTQHTVLFVTVIPIALLVVAVLLYPSTGMADGNGKNVKVLSLANCGMGAAVDIGVIRERVLGFLSMPLAQRLRLSETNLFMQALGAIRLARRSGSSILRIGRFCWRI